MKKYLILGEALGIGGWQLYVDARTEYLTKKGCQVFVLHSNTNQKSKVKLKSLLTNPVILCEDFASPYPFEYSDRAALRVVKTIKDKIGYCADDEIFIESTAMYYALWGELLAKHLRGVNFVYLLHSHIDSVNEQELSFYDFKYSQQLLAGMSEKTLYSLFLGHKDITPQNAYEITASWKSPICECSECNSFYEEVRQRIPKEETVIGYFGTLNKPNFLLICDEICKFVSLYPSVKFCFLSIGSSFDGHAEEYQESIAQKCDNVRCLNIPEMYPVPKKIFEMLHVCIGSFGSAITASRGGAATISLVDDIGITPQGVLGYTTAEHKQSISSKAGKESLQELLKAVLIDKMLENAEYHPIEPFIDYEIWQEKEDRIVKPFVFSSERIEYYDVMRMKQISKKGKCKRLMYTVLGYRLTTIILRAKRRINNRNKGNR